MSQLIKFENIKQQFTEKPLYYDVNGQVSINDRVGLIGQNGSGKSTLLKILLRELKPDSGYISLEARSVGYVPQDAATSIDSYKYSCILDVSVQFNEGLIKQYVALKDAELKMQSDPDSYLKALNDYQNNGGFQYQTEVETLLKRAGFDEVEIHLQEFRNLSEGQKRLVFMISAIARNPELLVLDEPTNHVDNELKQKYIDLISAYKGGVLVVSHDRELLSKACNRIWEMEDGVLQKYKGNWDTYEREHRKRLEDAVRNYERQTKEVVRLEELKEEYQRKAKLYASKAWKAKISNVEHRIIKIEKSLPAVEPTREKEVIKGDLSYEGKYSQFPVVIDNLTISIGEKTLIKNLNLKLKYGEKVEIRGKNGSGKSTLLKSILEICDYADISGDIRVAPSVKIGYFNQKLQFANESISLFNYISKTFGVERTQTHGLMSKYLFDKSYVDTYLSELSGGEKNRVHLMSLIEGNYNLLILDEPTNHLDLYAMEALEEMLKKYNGAVLLVSHDRYFARNIADRVVEI